MENLNSIDNINNMDCDSINFLFRQVVKLYRHRGHTYFGKLGLYPGQSHILFMLWEKDGRCQKEFVEKLSVKPATITIMLGRMEHAKLVKRQIDSQDLRITRVYLTEKGKEIRSQVEEIQKKLEQEFLSGFTCEEKILFRRLLIQVRNNFINTV